MSDDRARAVVEQLVGDVPDFPEPGIVFKDITPLLRDADAMRTVVDALAAIGRDASGAPAVHAVVGMEARGFLLGVPVALALGVGFVPVRKTGKLPRETHETSYALEYGEASLAVHTDGVRPGERVLVVDDVLATGGTVAATRELVERCGGTVHACALLLELSFLDGRDALGDLGVHSLLTV